MGILVYKGFDLKSRIVLFELYPIPGDCSKLGIPNLTRVPLLKSWLILQTARFTTFTVSEFLREN